jgi:hypothetical protein
MTKRKFFCIFCLSISAVLSSVPLTNFMDIIIFSKFTYARVAELVDAPDSKSGDSNIVPVRVRPLVPLYFFYMIIEDTQLIYAAFFVAIFS